MGLGKQVSAAKKKLAEKVREHARKSKFCQKVNQTYNGVGQDNMKTPSPIRHPIDFYQHLKHPEVHAVTTKKVNAGGQAVRWRVVNGPELNILLLGVPFLIDFADDAVKARAAKQQARRAAKTTQPDAIRLKAMKPTGLKIRKADPLPQMPFSDQAQNTVYQGLLAHGVSPDAARQVASGEFEGQDLADHLSEADVEAVTEYLTGEHVAPADDA